MKKIGLIKSIVAVCIILNTSFAQQSIVVKVNQHVAAVQPTMWGIFFEDINLGADGGIYAELIKNRSFEFQSPLMGWTLQGKNFKEGDVLVQNRQENAANPRFIRVNAHVLQKANRV
jgi:alpha-N-arabinofuranosidase